MASTYEKIASYTLTSTSTGVTFSSIPATYTDLNLVLNIKGSTDSIPAIRLNSDTAYNYSYTSDISNLNVIINNKTECYYNDNEIYMDDTIELLRDYNKLKDYNIIIEISFLGLFIYDYTIINKWLIKTIKIDEVLDDFDEEEEELLEEDEE